MTNVSRNPTTSANYAYPGTSGRDNWTLTSGASAYIFANLPAGKSVDLVFSGFDFASEIPAGASIDGIQFNYLGSSDGVATDSRVVLRVGTGPDSDNKAKVTNWPGSTSNRSYGSTAGDTWGLAAANPGMTLSEIVRSSNFSVAIQINNVVGDPEDLARTYVTGGVGVTVNWSLAATVKPFTVAETMTLTGSVVGGPVRCGTIDDGAVLSSAAVLAAVRGFTVADGASLSGIADMLTASPVEVRPESTITITETGSRVVDLDAE
jgi:hypothetical protein